MIPKEIIPLVPQEIIPVVPQEIIPMPPQESIPITLEIDQELEEEILDWFQPPNLAMEECTKPNVPQDPNLSQKKR